jgi:uncharacterized protein (DUF488 family)
VFYRRKVLLALLEAFGGSLAKTDCQKLLFLFCSQRKKNYYDFFPYKYGGFSFLVYQDKSRLTDLGLLSSHDHFQLTDRQFYLNQLHLEDRVALQALVTEIGDLRGEGLIRKVYLEYPYYASHSKIAQKVLKKAEYQQISKIRNNMKTPCLFTIGYEGLSIDAFLNTLIANNIVALVDVRKNPLSMKYGFSKTRLANYTRMAGILYYHIPKLGVPSDLRHDLNNEAAYKRLFEYYLSRILPEQKEAIEELKTILHEHKRVALTCFEANAEFCHRHKIAEYLQNDLSFDTPVIHLRKDFTVNALLEYTSNADFPHNLWDGSGLNSLLD